MQPERGHTLLLPQKNRTLSIIDIIATGLRKLSTLLEVLQVCYAIRHKVDQEWSVFFLSQVAPTARKPLISLFVKDTSANYENQHD